MISFEQISKVNSELKLTDVKGKAYAEVPQRVQAFRKLFPSGFISTDMISNENGVCVFRANAGYYDEHGTAVILCTGTAYEREGSSFINKTSYIENCETSAVGRCLGFLGLGSEGSIASAEEVGNAIAQQQEEKPIRKSPASKVTEGTKVPVPSQNGEVKKFLKAAIAKLLEINPELNFTDARQALINAEVIEDIPSEKLTIEQASKMIDAIRDNFCR